MQRVITSSFVLGSSLMAGTVVGKGIRGIVGDPENDASTPHQEQQPQPQRKRDLFGMEYGMDGFNHIFNDLEDENPLEEGSVKPDDLPKDVNPKFFGRQVFFDAEDSSTTSTNNNDEASNDSLRNDEYATRIVNGNVRGPMSQFTMHLTYKDVERTWHNAGCGGTLISECHILTAGHCVRGERADLPNGLYVNAWRPFDNNGGNNFHFSMVESIDVHPDFQLGPNIHDVAIIKLTTCVPNRGQYPPMKLADQNFMSTITNGMTTKVVGFGNVGEGDSTLVEQLMETDVPFIDTNRCRDYYGNRITDDMICAGLVGGRDACQGDSGGPQFVVGPGNQLTQIGVVSWGVGCGRSDKPGVYANIADHLTWIQGIVCNAQGVNTNGLALCGSNGNSGNSPTPPQPTPQPTPLPTPPSVSPGSSTSGQCSVEFGQTCSQDSDCCDYQGIPLSCIQPHAICFPKSNRNTSKHSQYRKDRRDDPNVGNTTGPAIDGAGPSSASKKGSGGGNGRRTRTARGIRS